MSIKYFIYARKSTESEDRQMASIDDQISEMRKQADEYGFEIVDVIFESRSAKEPGRAAFNEMLSRIHKGEASGIVCWSLNRLARNPVDGGQISWLLQQNIIHHIKTHSRDYRPADNVLMMQVEFGMANQYVKDLSVDVKRGLRKKAERGWYPSPNLPLGYTHHKTTSIGSQAEIVTTYDFPIIKRLWKLMLSGEYSVAAIMREAKRLGLRNRYGRPYAKQAFWGMFNNEFYAGAFYWNDERGEKQRFRGKHKRMVTDNEFQKVQSILRANSIPVPQKGTLKFTYSNLIDCGECGRSVTGEWVYQAICPKCKHKFSIKHRTVCPKCKHDLKSCSKFSRIDKTYYQCTKYRTNCEQRTIQPAEIEKQVLAILERIKIEIELYEWIIRSLNEFQDEVEQDSVAIVSQLKKRATEFKNRLRSLVKMRADGEISADEMIDQKTTTANELLVIETELARYEENNRKWITAIDEALNLATNAVEVFKNSDNDARKQLLRNLLSNLKLKDKKLYYTTNKAVRMVNECQPIYTALKRTSEPEKSVATYGELGHSDPLRNVMRGVLNEFRTHQIKRLGISEKNDRN